MKTGDCDCDRCKAHETCIDCGHHFDRSETRYHVEVAERVIRGPLCLKCRTKVKEAA